MTNTEFELGGVCHLALVCKDMQRTVDFYTNVLGMKLAMTLDLPNGGQHFFFDMGGGQFIAFFWFAGAPEHSPGIASPTALPGKGDIRTAHGSMNHVSFKIPAGKFEEYKAKLEAKGVVTAPILNHDESERGWSLEITETTFQRSMYFFDPDGILLEFAAWTRELRETDVQHAPVDSNGVPASTTAGA
ncbi:VOC family protein [Streptomyces sp. NPDC004609]|uniref:VOC family protein n=1 Tax=Streptomyces sp. NPDC004609 TaxID=3364704 RepID=UPI00367AEB83